jgi:hypothetical protein
MVMTIDKLPFPLWVLVYREDSPWRPVTLTPGLAVAFSHHTQAADFLRAAGNPAWEARLVARVTWGTLLKDFRKQGASGIALDPSLYGGGTPIAFGAAETE